MADVQELVERPSQVPLTELLTSIPADYRAEWTDAAGLQASHYAPVGRYCHQAAATITDLTTRLAAAEAREARLREALKRISELPTETLWDIPDRYSGDRPEYDTLDANEVREIAATALTETSHDD